VDLPQALAPTITVTSPGGITTSSPLTTSVSPYPNVRSTAGARNITVPVTVAFGAKDRVLTPARGQGGDELPPHAVWTPLPECGHVPMLDDADLVADTICGTARRVKVPPESRRPRQP
jgi:pimeloyl-ACP methyl ester carboxylesterase